MEAVDLTGVPAVDNHCHGVAADQTFADVVSWRRRFTESTDPGMPGEHVATTALYRRLIRTLAPFLDCDPTEEAVFAARTARNGRELTAELLRAANIGTLLLDTGFPPPEEVFPRARTRKHPSASTGDPPGTVPRGSSTNRCSTPCCTSRSRRRPGKRSPSSST